MSRSHTPTLRDRRLAARLRSDGFTSFPLLGPTERSRLRELFGELRGWDGSGFQTDLQHPDSEYRRTVNAELGAALGDRVSERFDGYQPFLYNFLCKFPGEDSGLYLHRDWMYVDERTGARTFVVWIPLQDVRGDNGRLRVLRGSHAIEEALRGTDLVAPWLDHVDVLDARLRSLRVDAGTAVVMDNRLTHCSYPNLSPDPRLVVAVGMRPTSAPLVHFRRRDADTAVRYDVDEDFFCRHTPQDLLAAAPPLEVAEVLPDGQDHWTPGELAARIDVGWRAGADRAARRAAGVPEQVRQLRRLDRRDRALRRPVPPSLRSGTGRGTGPVRRVLVISSSPDDRASTTSLHEIVDELRRRALDAVDVWFLTDPDHAAWEGSVVLDAPLRGAVLGPLSRISLLGTGRRLRGVRRHVWLARSRPDLVVLDDGLGAPLLQRLTRAHVRAWRCNPVPPTTTPADLLATVADPDLAIVGVGAGPAAPEGVPVLQEHSMFSAEQTAADQADQRRAAREALGLDDDARLVLGAGAHGWVDGPDLFLRAMWHLIHRLDVDAHGAWLLDRAAPGELDPLLAEIERCELAGRVQVVTEDGGVDLRAAADVALLPYRDVSDPAVLPAYLDRSIPTVSFPVWALDDPRLELVDHLDVDAAAAAVARHLAERRAAHATIDDTRPPVARWVDALLEAVAGLRD